MPKICQYFHTIVEFKKEPQEIKLATPEAFGVTARKKKSQSNNAIESFIEFCPITSQTSHTK